MWEQEWIQFWVIRLTPKDGAVGLGCVLMHFKEQQQRRKTSLLTSIHELTNVLLLLMALPNTIRVDVFYIRLVFCSPVAWMKCWQFMCGICLNSYLSCSSCWHLWNSCHSMITLHVFYMRELGRWRARECCHSWRRRLQRQSLLFKSAFQHL